MLSPESCNIFTNEEQNVQTVDDDAEIVGRLEHSTAKDYNPTQYTSTLPSTVMIERGSTEALDNFCVTENSKERILANVSGVSRQCNKYYVKQVLSNKFCHPMYKHRKRKKMSRENVFDYIRFLESTVKKQRKIIGHLNMKLKRLTSVNYHKESKSEGLCSSRIPRKKQNNLDGNEGNKLETSVLNDKIGNTVLQNVNNSAKTICEDKSQNVLRHDSGKRQEICDTPVSFSPSKENLKDERSDNLNFIENNLEVQIIETDYRVHLHSSELYNANNDLVEYDEEVKRCIGEFMVREDISVADPSTESEDEELNSRFRRHFLGVLYKQFHAEVTAKCTFSQFCNSIPISVVKPSPTYWRNFLCSRCENTELKFVEIISKVLQRNDIKLENVLVKQDLFEHISRELFKLKGSQTPFTYRSWAKTLLGKTEASERIVTTTVGSACADILKELDMLKEHLVRCYNQYEAVKEAREESEISPIHAVLHIDWYESPATFIARHMHTAYYYGEGCKTMHVGYVRTKEKSFGFASLSDCREYTAPAVWASINDILVALAKDGMKVITVVSDPAAAQYRNKGNFYLMRRFAKQNNIEMKWIYLEGGHGKGIAESVGTAVKQIICDTIAQYPNLSIRNTGDILPLIKDVSPIKIFSHSEKVVQQYKTLLSRQHLQVIPSTSKIHEVCVKETSFYVKESSADKLPFFSLDTQAK